MRAKTDLQTSDGRLQAAQVAPVDLYQCGAQGGAQGSRYITQGTHEGRGFLVSLVHAAIVQPGQEARREQNKSKARNTDRGPPLRSAEAAEAGGLAGKVSHLAPWKGSAWRVKIDSHPEHRNQEARI